MTVKELIEELEDCPQDAEIFHGSRVRQKPEGTEPAFELYDFDVTAYPKVKSYRSACPQWDYHDNVVVLEYT